MNVTDLKLNSRYWCYWLHRYLLYKGKTQEGLYIFEDFGNDMFFLTKAQLNDLKTHI